MNVLSTNVQPDTSGSVCIKQKNGSVVQCPISFESYSTYMRGVDQNDQFRQYYSVRYKSHKFFKNIFWFLFELALTNAFILFRKHINPEETMRVFRDNWPDRQPGRVRWQQQYSAPTQNHYPKNKNWKEIKSKTVSSLLIESIRRETTWQCQECSLPLCHTGEDDGTDCFEIYHKTLWLI